MGGSERNWSGKRDSNPRLRPWQGRTLPLSYSRSLELLKYHTAGVTFNFDAGRDGVKTVPYRRYRRAGHGRTRIPAVDADHDDMSKAFW